MDFLNKLYESNYFGIGLFAVISFLVVSFLIVLFFGKKDEKKRKLEEMSPTRIEPAEDTFKETTPVTPLEMPVMPEVAPPVADIPIAPVPPVNYDIPTEPVSPIINEVPVTPIKEDIPVTPVVNNPVSPIIEPVAPVVTESMSSILNNSIPEPVSPIINEPVKPIISEPTPIINNDQNRINEPITPVINERPVIEPVRFDIPTPSEPKVMDPVKINIPEEPVRVSPVIEPIIKEEKRPIYTEPTPIIEEPVISGTYYKPIEKVEHEEVKVPNIDFDAIAKSISEELDELEQSTNRSSYEEIKVTPINEVTNKEQPKVFSSVYVNEPVRKTQAENIDLPKRIDLPTKKSDEVSGENYNI